MRGKLYLHIGPPKTATTSLQRCLQDGLDGLVVYGGVTQPRSHVRNELSTRLHESSARGATPSDIGQLRDEIESVLAAGRHLFVSEEMFLVDRGDLRHQDKIRELSRIIGVFSPRVIVGLRDPVAGLRSLYQELHRSLPLRQRLCFRPFLASNQAKVFDYEHLLSLLTVSGLGNVGVISFDRFVNNEVWLGEIMEVSPGSDRRLLPSKMNQSDLDGSGRRRFRAMNLSDLGHNAVTKIPCADALARIVLRDKGARRIWTAIRDVRVWQKSSRALLVPPSLRQDLQTKFERVSQLQDAPLEPSLNS